MSKVKHKKPKIKISRKNIVLFSVVLGLVIIAIAFTIAFSMSREIPSPESGNSDAVSVANATTEFVLEKDEDLSVRFSEFECNSDCSNVLSVAIGGRTLKANEDYEVRRGSIVIIVYKKVMQSLKNGYYDLTISVNYNGEIITASAKVIVKQKAQDTIAVNDGKNSDNTEDSSTVDSDNADESSANNNSSSDSNRPQSSSDKPSTDSSNSSSSNSSNSGSNNSAHPNSNSRPKEQSQSDNSVSTEKDQQSSSEPSSSSEAQSVPESNPQQEPEPELEPETPSNPEPDPSPVYDGTNCTPEVSRACANEPRADYTARGGWEDFIRSKYDQYKRDQANGYYYTGTTSSALCYASFSIDFVNLVIYGADWDDSPTPTCNNVRNQHPPVPSDEYLTNYLRSYAY